MSVLSLTAALVFALSSSLKHVSAGNLPDAQTMRVGRLARFARATISHPLWLSGIACDAVGLTLQAWALHLGALAVVQPLLASSLVFAVILRQLHAHHYITRREIGWTVVLSAALAGFLVLATVGNTSVVGGAADRAPAVVSGCVGLLLAATCVELGRRQRHAGRTAALLGVAVGVIYAATAAVLKAVTDIIARHPGSILISWQPYVLVVLGGSGLLLNQLAFQAGPFVASLPATATVDPLLSIVVGVLVYDEHIRSGPGAGTVLAALLLLLGVAAIQLARDGPAGGRSDVQRPA
ncbi:MAG TPA: DMT family transporter [Acidothermaceae bacterium]|nr:DMT family transporter [Acidothermaceae bacterium]